MKHFNIKDYIYDFKTLPLSLVYSFEDPNEQLGILNKLILEYMKQHAPCLISISTKLQQGFSLGSQLTKKN